MATMWNSDSAAEWRAALDSYEAVIERQDVARLPELDRWYREDLPAAIAGRRTAHVTHDELVGAQVPGLGTVAFTPAYYAKYAAALRDRAEKLGAPWTPSTVEQALWAHVGGKAGTRKGKA